MVEQKNEIFDEDGKFKKELIPRLMGQLIQESFVTGILYVNLTTENDPGDDPGTPNKLYGFVEIRTKDSVFAELSESINLEKLSKQLSQLMETATEKLGGLAPLQWEVIFPIRMPKFRISSRNFPKLMLPGPSLTETSVEAKSAFAEIAAFGAFEQNVGSLSDFRFGFSDT